jgi:hypothetical protein
MKLYPIIEEKYLLKYNEGSIVEQLENNGATFKGNNYEIRCPQLCLITGSIERCEKGFVLIINSSMPKTYVVFSILWTLLTVGAIMFTISYEGLVSIPTIITFAFLVLGNLALFLKFNFSVVPRIISIKRALRINSKMKY